MQKLKQFCELSKHINSAGLIKPKGSFNYRGHSIALSTLALTACGGGGDDASTSAGVGYPSNYVPPSPTPTSFIGDDVYADTLLVTYTAPYWVGALSIDQGESLTSTILDANKNTLSFAFPDAEPSYDMVDIVGWSPATEQMKVAAREIFTELNQVLGASFTETADIEYNNVLAIGVSRQSTTAAFAYFPNPDFFIGSDVFIANDYDAPAWLSATRTNYNYEVLLHEIGHAIGLKHPFEADAGNTTTLNAYEDQTQFTTMSYDDTPSTFNGTFRPLDWMTLTKFYGVNLSYQSGDNIYSFSSSGGVFIIDGAGLDTIDASETSSAVSVDLRPGMQSWLGSKSQYITAANQMTISHGSVIENVFTGSGGDVVMGNEFQNTITTGAGQDTIYAGDGADVVNPGAGQDQIDFSETTQTIDRLIFDTSSLGQLADTVFGFAQGLLGDVIELSGLLTKLDGFLPLISTQAVPIGIVDNCVVRVIGDEITSTADLSKALYQGGALDSLELTAQAATIFVVASSQDTGETQDLYHASFDGAGYESTHLAQFVGSMMDIDSWAAHNFTASQTTLIA